MNSNCREKLLSNDYGEWLLDFKLTEDLLSEAGQETDFCFQQIDDNLGIVSLRREQADSVNLLSAAYQHIPNLFGLQKDIVTEGEFDAAPLLDSGIIQVQRPPLNLTGRGVVLGFVDTGIDYNNPVFKRSDGSSRILAIWDQTIQEGAPPEGFFYGTEYRQEEINKALQSENGALLVPTKDTNGHGTALASIAAGSSIGQGSRFLGAAYDADIVVVKLKECKPYLRDYYMLPEDVPAYQSTDIIMAVQYLDSFVRAFYRPVVICLGVGSSFGGHSGNALLSQYLNRVASKRSRVVVVAGGNEGNSGHHYEGQLNPISTDGLVPRQEIQEIEIRVGEGEKGFLTEIWGKAPNVFSVAIRSPGGEMVPNTGVRLSRGWVYRFVYEQTRITVNYALVEGTTGDEVILVRFENPTPGIWTLLLQNDSGLPEADFHIWLPISAFLSGETFFLKPCPDITMTLPVYTENAIGVSTYDSRNNSFYVESGRGFSRSSMIKPDIAAPGVGISIARPSVRGKLMVGEMTGSSAAVALAAGGAAQFLQWAVTDRHATYLRSSDVKNYLIRGAARESIYTYPSRQWGFGRLNIKGIFDSMVTV